MEWTPPAADYAAGPAEAIDPLTYWGKPLVDEAAIVSPGVAGRVFNPIVIAEFRRWRARPITYSAMVLVILAAICTVYYSSRAGLPLPFPRGNRYVRFLETVVGLLVRPSTILPVMMVWRALVSFRDGGLYERFRTTFLTPAEFLWGMIAVPFAVSAVILVAYTGGVLVPGIIERHFSRPPDQRTFAMFWSVAGILFEGAVNGALICFVALYFGIRGRAHLGALFPIITAVLLIESAQAFGHLSLAQLQGTLSALGAPRIAHEVARELSVYVVMGTPKLVLCAVFWLLTSRLLRKPEE